MIAHIVKNDSAFVNWQKSITKLFFIQNHLELGRLWPLESALGHFIRVTSSDQQKILIIGIIGKRAYEYNESSCVDINNDAQSIQ